MPLPLHNSPLHPCFFQVGWELWPLPLRPGPQARHECWPPLLPPMRPFLMEQPKRIWWSQGPLGVWLSLAPGYSSAHTAHHSSPVPGSGFQLQAFPLVLTVPQPSPLSPVWQDHYWNFPWQRTRMLPSCFQASRLELCYVNTDSSENNGPTLLATSIAIIRGKTAPIYWMHMLGLVLEFVLLVAEGPTLTGSNLCSNYLKNMWYLSQVVWYMHLI